jgi:hypothetical protein
MPPEYGYSKVISETVQAPIEGVTELKIDGVINVWIGKNESDSCWMPKKKYIEKYRCTFCVPVLCFLHIWVYTGASTLGD